MTSFAGSIGIIGIALILALSTGIQNYVNAIQKDTLTSYPITVEREPNDFMSMLTAANEKTDDETLKNRDADSVYSDPRLYKMLNATVSDGDEVNDLASFKKYIDSELDASTAKTDLREYVSSVRYGYGLTVNAYVIGTDGKYHSTDMTSALFADDETSEGDKGVSMINMMTSRMGNMNLSLLRANGRRVPTILCLLLIKTTKYPTLLSMLSGLWTPPKSQGFLTPFLKARKS